MPQDAHSVDDSVSLRGCGLLHGSIHVAWVPIIGHSSVPSFRLDDGPAVVGICFVFHDLQQ